jgi:N-acetylmuramoyl-L-alanine amidase
LYRHKNQTTETFLYTDRNFFTLATMRYVYAFILIFFLACSRSPYYASNKAYKKQVKAFAKQMIQSPPKDSLLNLGDWVGTTNFNLRKPNFVIIHHTAQNSCGQTLKTFTTKKTEVSAHYVICRDGTIHHMLNDYFRAWHGGAGKGGNLTDVNSSSIGIELDNNGSEPFSEAQINSLLSLLGNLKRAYNIPTANFIGHADIAPTRKVDPSIYFPWKQLAEKGFGNWYDTIQVVTLPDFKSMETLRMIGYDVKDSAAAVRAFRIHFMQDSLTTIDTAAQKILFSLYKKYQ